MSFAAEHLIRTIAAAVAFLAILGTYLVLAITEASPGVSARLEGMLVPIIPMVWDTLRVQKRERQRNSIRPPQREGFDELDDRDAG